MLAEEVAFLKIRMNRKQKVIYTCSVSLTTSVE